MKRSLAGIVVIAAGLLILVGLALLISLALPVIAKPSSGGSTWNSVGQPAENEAIAAQQYLPDGSKNIKQLGELHPTYGVWLTFELQVADRPRKFLLHRRGLNLEFTELH